MPKRLAAVEVAAPGVKDPTMAKYHIDEMRGDDAVALHIVTAESPLEALKKVISGPFVIRTSEPNWFRVVDESQSEVFSYAPA